MNKLITTMNDKSTLETINVVCDGIIETGIINAMPELMLMLDSQYMTSKNAFLIDNIIESVEEINWKEVGVVEGIRRLVKFIDGRNFDYYAPKSQALEIMSVETMISCLRSSGLVTFGGTLMMAKYAIHRLVRGVDSNINIYDLIAGGVNAMNIFICIDSEHAIRTFSQIAKAIINNKSERLIEALKEVPSEIIRDLVDAISDSLSGKSDGIGRLISQVIKMNMAAKPSPRLTLVNSPNEDKIREALYETYDMGHVINSEGGLDSILTIPGNSNFEPFKVEIQSGGGDVYFDGIARRAIDETLNAAVNAGNGDNKIEIMFREGTDDAIDNIVKVDGIVYDFEWYSRLTLDTVCTHSQYDLVIPD